MKKTAVVTIASTNYFAQVQILIDSLAKTNPSWDRFFGVADAVDDDLIEACRNRCKIIEMKDLDIPNLDDMKFRYDIMELNTAIKPFVLLHLLKSYDRVVYMDPDICVYRELTAVNKAFDDGYEFVLTPHFTDYWKEDGKHPNEPDILLAGTYNFGFFAAANCQAAKTVISWWAKKLETLCVNKQAEGIFVDQKWMDLLPARHDKVFILRDSGYNIAYWNLSHRIATYRGGEYFFNGEPLVFFHFSGYNPKDIDNVSKHQNRHDMDSVGVARQLFYDYAGAALDNGYDTWRQKKYAFNKFSDGRAINDIFRQLYRDIPAVEEKIGRKNPFKCSDVFYDQKEWLAPFIINYILQKTKDIGVYFLNTKREQWIQWFCEVCETQYKLNNEWIEYLRFFLTQHLMQFTGEKIEMVPAPSTRELLDGINVIGYIKSEHGLGEACRLTADALSTTTINWSIYDWEMNNPSRQTDVSWESKIENNIPYNISVFNINADQLMVAKEHLPKEAWQGYRIGIWYWELTEFPEQWCPAFELVDEIWAPTRFIQENLMKKATCPVIYMPPGLRRAEPDTKYSRAYFGLPENTFLYLNIFDIYSYTGRKNPYAAIKAFQKAFSADDMSVGLVLKINNVSLDSGYIKELEKVIGEYKNIYIIAKTITRDEVNGLLNICDVAVSLHRSEGLGLLCEEAMYFGKPVIATNWSGNTDFMNESCACLVDYNMIPVGEYYGTSGDDNQKWADPDVVDASRYMLRLLNDKEYYDKIARNAKDFIRTSFSPEVCGRRMEKRIREIQAQKDKVTRYDRELQEVRVCVESEIEVIPEKSDFENDCRNLNEKWSLKYYRPIEKNGRLGGLRVFFKRIVRKLCRSLIEPLTVTQSEWNASVTRILNALIEQNGAKDNAIYRLEEENFALKNEMSRILEKTEKEIEQKTGNVQVEEDEWKASVTRRLNEIIEQNGAMANDIRKFEGENIAFKNEIVRSTEKTEIDEGISSFREEEMKMILTELGDIQSKLDMSSVNEMNNTNNVIQHMGSLYNALFHTIMQLNDVLQKSEDGSSVRVEKEFIENKWRLIDKYYHEPQKMQCCICGEEIETTEAEKLISEDIYGGGQLIRYRCPWCGAVVGPNKMLDLSRMELSEEYKHHYKVNSEGDTTAAEIETFMALKPEKGKRYLNYGCGAWTKTIEELRSQGYDVYGFEPYAPCDSQYVITDFDILKQHTFDGIFSHDVLEHLRYPVETFEIFAEILKADGKMAHSTACYKYVYEYDRFHLVFYTGNSVKTLCERTGFVLKDKIENSYNLSFNYLYEKRT